MYLPVLKYKYYKKRTQISYSTALSRFFSSEILTNVWKGEEDSTIEDQVLVEFK